MIRVLHSWDFQDLMIAIDAANAPLKTTGFDIETRTKLAFLRFVRPFCCPQTGRLVGLARAGYNGDRIYQKGLWK